MTRQHWKPDSLALTRRYIEMEEIWIANARTPEEKALEELLDRLKNRLGINQPLDAISKSA